MKKLLMILMFGFTLCPPSQAGNYQRLLVEGRRWVYEELWWEDGIEHPQYKEMEHYVTIEGDTLFQGKDCKRIFDMDDVGSRLIGVAYEEEKKVYCYMFTDTIFHQFLAPELNKWELLYDFGSEVGRQSGMVGILGSLVFEQVDTIWAKGCNYARQIWGYPAVPHNSKSYLVEGIGCESGLLPIWDMIDNGCTTRFLACYDGDELLFSADDFYVSSMLPVVAPHSASPSSRSCYDLSGRNIIGQPTRGIYIRNGKKYIIR